MLVSFASLSEHEQQKQQQRFSSPVANPLSKEFVEAKNAENNTSSIIEGSVNPKKEMIPPTIPPLNIPMAMPTWDEAGPGRNWQIATMSAYNFSSIHFLFCTYSSRKYAKYAAGPPKEVNPNLVEALAISKYFFNIFSFSLLH